MSFLDRLFLTQRFAELGPRFYREAWPQPLSNPELILLDTQVAASLGLTPAQCRGDEFLRVFSGGELPVGCQPLALDYAGHQFGRFNPLLGDGRVLLLGGLETASGYLEISLKGSGRTPYARDADGRATLSECLHEFETSRCLAGLGIPVTRCLCVIAGDQQAYRRGYQRAAILVRVAPSHLRFGTFENLYFQNDKDALADLLDYLLRYHYGDRVADHGDRRVGLLQAMVEDTARLIARWQAVGFVHGMMNTDNQSAVGITLDLGAADFTPTRRGDFIASALDRDGRYAFAEQPSVGLWNCNVLARALSPLIPAAGLREALLAYEPAYLEHYQASTAA